MKKIIGLLAAFSLVVGMALAGGSSNPPNNEFPRGDNYSTGKEKVSFSQNITLRIPPRVALHLDTPKWDLDLSNIKDEACFAVSKLKAAELESSGVSSAFEWLIKQAESGLNSGISSWDDGGEAALTGLLTGIDGIWEARSYPAVDLNDPGSIEGDHDKGYVMCFFGKVVQKFANTPGWDFKATVKPRTGKGWGSKSTMEGFGQFALASIRQDGSGGNGFVTTTAPTSGELDSATDTTTGGWLDSFILEGFYFDGSEVALKSGTYNLQVEYTLTGSF